MALNFSLEGTHLTITNLERVDKESGVVCDTSAMNAIKRATMSTSKCYAISSKVNADELNKNLGLDLPKSIEYAVNMCNFEPIDFLADRFSRLPVMLSSATEDLLTENKLFVVLLDKGTLNSSLSVSDKLHKPFIYTEDLPLRIYAQDLTVVALPKDQGALESKKMEGEGESGKAEESELAGMRILSKEEVVQLFPYNVHLLNLYKGHKIRLIAPIVDGFGYDQSQFMPCPVRYRFVQEGVEEGKDSAKPIEYTVDDMGNPNRIELIVEENGKKQVTMAVMDALLYLIRQLNAFKSEYNRDDSEIVVKEASVAGGIIANIFNGEAHYSEDGKYDSVDYLADYTISNLLSSHILYRVMEIYNQLVADGEADLMELLSTTQIAHKKPHPNPRVVEVKLFIQLPENEALFKKLGVDSQNNAYRLLVEKTCDELIKFYQGAIRSLQEASMSF